jgi:hypothetical protein
VEEAVLTLPNIARDIEEYSIEEYSDLAARFHTEFRAARI